MKRLTLMLLSMLLSMLVAGLAQAGTVRVSFDHPERFADTGDARHTETVLATVAQHLQALGEARLPAGQTLTITVTDIDLAGTMQPWRGRFPDVRVMGCGVDWPRIELHYTLGEGDRVLAQASARVVDMDYLMRFSHLRPNDPLPYEQRMLSEWFSRTFGPVSAP